MATPTKKKRPSYTDDFRANAVVLLQAEGYPDKKGALTIIANRLEVPARTLSRWFNKEQNAPPDQLVNEKKGDLVESIHNELYNILFAMTHARPDANYRDLGTVFGIMADKLQLLQGKPTQITNDLSANAKEQLQQRLAHLTAVGAANRPSDIAH